MDFADDIALLSDEIEGAKQLLRSVETECGRVGLRLNAKKTKFMTYNIDDDIALTTREGKEISRALTDRGEQDFKYLGSWIATTEHDVEVRKAMAWVALHRMSKIWRSRMTRGTKLRLFQSAVVSILLYCADTWAITKEIRKRLDGTYTRMLRMALNISWRSHTTNEELYRGIPKLSDVIQKRRLQLAGHSYRQLGTPVGDTVTWDPTHGHPNRGRTRLNYLDVLKEDTGIKVTSELQSCMRDRKIWKCYVSRCQPATG